MSYHIRTETGKRFEISEQDGAITSENWRTPDAAHWRINGLAERGHFNHVYFCADWMEILDSGAPAFKNGKPRFYVRDLDHGHRRMWSDGIVAVWKD